MQRGSLIRSLANMAQMSGSFDGQRQAGTDDAFIGRESLELWTSIPMLSRPGGSPLAFSQCQALATFQLNQHP